MRWPSPTTRSTIRPPSNTAISSALASSSGAIRLPVRHHRFPPLQLPLRSSLRSRRIDGPGPEGEGSGRPRAGASLHLEQPVFGERDAPDREAGIRGVGNGVRAGQVPRAEPLPALLDAFDVVER